MFTQNEPNELKIADHPAFHRIFIECLKTIFKNTVFVIRFLVIIMEAENLHTIKTCSCVRNLMR